MGGSAGALGENVVVRGAPVFAIHAQSEAQLEFARAYAAALPELDEPPSLPSRSGLARTDRRRPEGDPGLQETEIGSPASEVVAAGVEFVRSRTGLLATAGVDSRSSRPGLV